MRDESLCEAYCDSVEQALSTSHIVNSDLPLDDWYGSVMGIIHQVASHLVEYWRALSQLDDSRSIVFRMWHVTARLKDSDQL